jgi:hypothetical protein
MQHRIPIDASSTSSAARAPRHSALRDLPRHALLQRQLSKREAALSDARNILSELRGALEGALACGDALLHPEPAAWMRLPAQE